MGILRGGIGRGGPEMDVQVMASSQRVLELKRRGLPYPMPVTIRAILDTGASMSAIEMHVLGGLGLTAKSYEPILTPSTAGGVPVERGVYDVGLTIGPKGLGGRFFTAAVIEAELASQGISGLIGWDILQACILTCDGPLKTFTLAF